MQALYKIETSLEPILKLSKDIKDAAVYLTDTEARYLVDTYYQMQDNRIRSDNQIRAMQEAGEPNKVIQHISDSSSTLENQVKLALGRYVDNHIVGDWLKSVMGIGDVLSAGLLAHIDIKKAHTAGAIWRYAGIDPTVEWLGKEKSVNLINSIKEKAGYGKRLKEQELLNVIELTCVALNRRSSGYYEYLAHEEEENTLSNFQKWAARRPYNAELKKLCWKIGESFIKVSNKDEAVYGKLFQERKARYIIDNDSGKYADQAAIRVNQVGKATDAFKHYSEGKLPPAQINARARRYAVKMFLSHLHQVWYERHFGKPAPVPFAIAHLGHVHKLEPVIK